MFVRCNLIPKITHLESPEKTFKKGKNTILFVHFKITLIYHYILQMLAE